MIGTVTSHLTFTGTATAVAKQAVRRPRRISPQAGHGLEMLGHAIEYLTDEYVNEHEIPTLRDGRPQAIELLMAVNREIYLGCPEVPSMRERIASFFSRLL
ncbi:MAG TPA: hypothetical protein VGJ21_22340 [Terracidiphilus sp.]